jgi:hypothetical protein
VICNSERFAAEVLPQYFNHANWTSFLRQLSAYHFKRVTVNDTPAYEQRDGFFQRSRPDLMALVKRRKDKRRPSSTDSGETTTSSTESPPHIAKNQAATITGNNTEYDAEADDNDTANDHELQHRHRRRRLDSAEPTTTTTTTLTTMTTNAGAWQSIPLPTTTTTTAATTNTTNTVTPVVPVPVQIRAAHEYDKILINFNANINLLGIEREFGKVISGLMGHPHTTLSADPLVGPATAAADELPDQQLVNELGLANSVHRTTIDTDTHATHA